MKRVGQLTAALLWLVASSCHSAKIPPTQAANARVEQGVANGFEASNKPLSTVFEVRHNPAACECPPYELFAYGRWIRIFIDTTANTQANLDNLRRDTLAVTKVNGRVEQKPRAAANGVPYLVLTAP